MNPYETPEKPRRRMRLPQLSKFHHYRRRFGRRSEFITMCHRLEAEGKVRRS